jgi:predicted phage terminase large subunit-like protein
MIKTKVKSRAEVAEFLRNDFYQFLRAFWDIVEPAPLIDNWHIQYLCDRLQQLASGAKVAQPLIINIPPNESKSTIASVMFPVWLWTVKPSARIMTVSYSASLSHALTHKSDRILHSALFKELWPIRVQRGRDGIGHKVNNYRGERLTTSVGGSITGFHADFIVIDDPLNPKEAMSAVERGAVNRWYDNTMTTRLVDRSKSNIVLVMQRLHTSDLSGHLIEKAEKNRSAVKPSIIRLPATLNGGEPYPAQLRQFYDCGMLNPHRNSPEILETIKGNIGALAYQAQLLQTPAKEGGNILKPEWFAPAPTDSAKAVHFALDTAYTADTANDPTGWMAFQKMGSGKIHVVGAGELWLEFPELIREVKSLTRRLGYSYESAIYVEPKASGKSVIQQLRASTDLNIVAAPSPTRDKVARVYAIAPAAEAGKITIAAEGDHESLLYQLAMFPNANHDDMVDCLTMAVDVSKAGELYF